MSRSTCSVYSFSGQILTAFICMLIASGTAFSVSARHSLGLMSFAFAATFLTRPQVTSKGCTFSWKLLLAGLFTSLAFWYSTEIGLYTLGAIGLFLLIYGLQSGIAARKRPLPLISYSCGVMLGFLPVGIYFLSHGALDDAIWNSYIQCRYQLEHGGSLFHLYPKHLPYCRQTDGAPLSSVKGFGGIYRFASF